MDLFFKLLLFIGSLTIAYFINFKIFILLLCVIIYTVICVFISYFTYEKKKYK